MQALVEHRHPKERKRPLYIFATQANDTKSIQVSPIEPFCGARSARTNLGAELLTSLSTTDGGCCGQRQ